MEVIAGLIILGGLYATGFLDFLNPYEFRAYTSPKFGYTVSYPRNWTLDDSRSTAALDLIHNANKNGVVFIQVFEHADYATPEGRSKAVSEMKNDFAGRAEYKLDSFTDEIRDGHHYFLAKGLYKDANGVWSFTQEGAFLGDRRAYNIVSRALSGHADEVGATLKAIVKSFKIQ